MRPALRLLFALPALLVAAGCSSSASPSGAGAGSDGGTSTSPSGSGGCPATPAYLLPLTSFSPNGGTIETIVSDGTTLYLGTQTGLFSLPAAGGTLSAVFGALGTGSTTSDVESFWFAGSNVLFVNDQEYVSVPKAGGATTSLASLTDAYGMAVSDGTNVYFVTNAFTTGGEAGVNMQYALGSVPVAGGTPTSILTFASEPTDLILSDGSLYWIQPSVGLFASGPIYQLAVTASTPVNLGIQAMKGQLAADDTYLYYSSPGTVTQGPVMRVAKSDLAGAPTQVSDLGGQWLALEGTDVYGAVVANGTYVAWKAPAAGGTATVIACAPSGTTMEGLGVDANSVYVSVTDSTSSNSGILRVAR